MSPLGSTESPISPIEDDAEGAKVKVGMGYCFAPEKDVEDPTTNGSAVPTVSPTEDRDMEEDDNIDEEVNVLAGTG